MPMVPRYDSPTVSPTGLPNVSVPDSAFGTEVARAVSGLGSQIEKSGDMLARQALAAQEDINRTIARDHQDGYTRESSDFLYNPKTGYFATQGKDAIDGHDAAQKKLDEIRDKWGRNLGPHTKRLYLDDVSRRVGYDRQLVGRHAAGQGKRYEADTLKSSIDLSQQQAGLTWNDDRLFDSLEGDIREDVIKLLQVQGIDPGSATAQQTIQNAVSIALNNRVRQAARTDLAEATRIFDKYHDKMNVDTRNNLADLLTSGRSAAGTAAEAEKYRTEKTVADAERSARETGQTPPEYNRDEVLTKLGTVKGREAINSVDRWRSVHQQTFDLPTLPDNKILDRLAKLENDAKTSDEAAWLYTNVRDQALKLMEARTVDPAFSVHNAPGVQEALKTWTWDDDFGRKMIIDARMAAQRQAGIAPEDMSPAMNVELRPYIATVKGATPGQERKVYDGVIKKLQQDFGDEWLGAFKQMRKAAVLSARLDMIMSNSLGAATRDISIMSPEEAQEITRKEEAAAAQKAMDDLLLGTVLPDPGVDPFAPPPVPSSSTPPPKPKSPSERILRKGP